MFRHLRTVSRLLRAGLHLGYGLFVVSAVYPWLGRRTRLHLKQRWSRQLLAMLGVGLEVGGTRAVAPMRVANHVSWLDVFVINAVAPSAFVAKDDVAGWPVIGRLARLTDTLFIERGSRRSSYAAAQRVAAALDGGLCVVAFPEGTTTAGEGVLPFRSALFQGAIEAGVDVQPLALRYLGAAGERSAAPVYIGDTSLLVSLWQVAAAPRLRACLTCLPPVAATRERRVLAAHCGFMVTSALALFDGRVLEPVKIVAPRMGASTGCSLSPCGRGLGREVGC